MYETLSNTEVVGLVQYKRQPKLCFHCGHWDHILFNCQTLPPNTSRKGKNKQEYGLWLAIDTK